MSSIVPLDTIPNQNLTIRLDNRLYNITVKEIGGMMAITVVRDGVTLLEGARVVSGTPVLPYPHLSRDAGNFMFTTTVSDVIPYYTDFGSTCQLIYSTAAEIEADTATDG